MISHIAEMATKLEVGDYQNVTCTNYSVGYPNNSDGYPNNAYDFWDIHAPPWHVVMLTVIDLELDDTDGLYFGDGIDSFSTIDSSCNSWRRLTDQDSGTNFTSYSRSAKLIFTSDPENNGKGFLLQVTVIKLQEDPSIVTGEVLHQTISDIHDKRNR